jgi:hypothetical protein
MRLYGLESHKRKKWVGEIKNILKISLLFWRNMSLNSYHFSIDKNPAARSCWRIIGLCKHFGFRHSINTSAGAN